MGPRLLLLGFSILALVASTAGAQVLEPPPRPSRGLFGGGPPPDPTRSRQDLDLDGSILGGYDDNLVSPAGGNAFVPHPSGYIAFSDVALRYSAGRPERSFQFGGRGFMNTYRNAGIGPSYGGEQTMSAHTPLGRR